LERWRGNDPVRLGRLQGMYQEWPYFRNLLDNVQMVLAKSDMEIAARYAELAGNPEQARHIHERIRAEFNRCLIQTLHITNSSHLLQDDLTLARSVVRRNPYLEPLNHIQIELLRRFRGAKDEQERHRWLDPLLRTINAISAGTRNTG
jgi:phosphoenolpyruvate carboxylase